MAGLTASGVKGLAPLIFLPFVENKRERDTTYRKREKSEDKTEDYIAFFLYIELDHSLTLLYISASYAEKDGKGSCKQV